MATVFPTFVDVPEGETPEPGTPDVDAAYLNSVNLAINTVENTLPGKADAGALHVVATSGAYTDLIGRPFIPDSPDDIGAQPAGSYQAADADLTAIAGLDSATAGTIASDGAGWVKKTYTQLKTSLGLVKADVGLGNVDNTSDLAKPISTATQTALDTLTAADTEINSDLLYINDRLASLDGITNRGNLAASATFTPDNGNGGAVLATLTQNTTITFAQGINDGKVKSLEVVLTQDATGGRTVTWASTIRWEGGTPPTLTTAANATDRLVFTSYNNGTVWYGDVIGLNYA